MYKNWTEREHCSNKEEHCGKKTITTLESHQHICSALTVKHKVNPSASLKAML